MNWKTRLAVALSLSVLLLASTPWVSGQGNLLNAAGVAILTTSLANYPLATTLTARNETAGITVEPGSRWSVVSTGAASAQASASIAAEAGVRHVLDHVCFSGQANAAVAATALAMNIRDGASGAGTIILHFTIAIPTGAGVGVQEIPNFCTPTVNLVGTTNTAMTAEFNAGVTNLIEDITITGYNVN